MDSYLSGLGPRLSIRSHSMEEMPHYDLTLVISAAQEIDVNFIYNNKSLDTTAVVRLARHFFAILEGIEENAANQVYKVEMLSAEEKHQLLKDFNSTDTDFPGEKTIHQLFEEQVERTPDNIAVIGKMQSAERKAQSIKRNKERHAPCSMRNALAPWPPKAKNIQNR